MRTGENAHRFVISHTGGRGQVEPVVPAASLQTDSAERSFIGPDVGTSAEEFLGLHQDFQVGILRQRKLLPHRQPQRLTAGFPDELTAARPCPGDMCEEALVTRDQAGTSNTSVSVGKAEEFIFRTKRCRYQEVVPLHAADRHHLFLATVDVGRPGEVAEALLGICECELGCVRPNRLGAAARIIPEFRNVIEQ